MKQGSNLIPARAQLAAEHPRLLELHDAAARLEAAARNDADRAYYRGYVSGIARRLAGPVAQDELEVVAFELLQDAPGGLEQVLGRGYRDGLAGKAIEG